MLLKVKKGSYQQRLRALFHKMSVKDPLFSLKDACLYSQSPHNPLHMSELVQVEDGSRLVQYSLKCFQCIYGHCKVVLIVMRSMTITDDKNV